MGHVTLSVTHCPFICMYLQLHQRRFYRIYMLDEGGLQSGSLTCSLTQRWAEASLVKDRQVNSGGDATIAGTKVPSRYWRIASEANTGNSGTKIPSSFS